MADAVRHPDGTFVIKGREHNVFNVGDEECQTHLIQLEHIEELLETTQWVEEAIVVGEFWNAQYSSSTCLQAFPVSVIKCPWRTNDSDSMVVPGLVAIIKPSKQLEDRVS